MSFAGPLRSNVFPDAFQVVVSWQPEDNIKLSACESYRLIKYWVSLKLAEVAWLYRTERGSAGCWTQVRMMIIRGIHRVFRVELSIRCYRARFCNGLRPLTYQTDPLLNQEPLGVLAGPARPPFPVPLLELVPTDFGGTGRHSKTLVRADIVVS